MMVFWSIAAVMTLAALFFVLPPLLGRGRASGEVRRELNIAIFRERLAELDEDLREGAINDAQYRQARSELEVDLLVDTEDVGTDSTRAAPLRKGRWAAALVAVVVPVIAVGLYWILGANEILANGGPQTQAGQQASIETMVANLAKRMQQQPDDAKGWIMLGRSYLVMRRYQDSVKAFERAHGLLGDDPDLLADYAEALSMSQGGRMAGKPLAMVDKVLAKDPENPKAIWLRGIGDYQRGDGAAAVKRWRGLLATLTPGSENARMVNAAIARVEGKNGTGAEPASRASAAKAGGAVQVHVALAPKLRQQASPDDTVFVFARALHGPPAPLAVIRIKVSDLPTTVNLNDSQAMVAGMNISSQSRVLVGARISKSGNPIAKAGDLEGTVSGVTVGDGKTVQLTIDHKVM